MIKLIPLLIFTFAVLVATGQDKIVIEPKPAKIWIEKGNYKQVINFDFLVSNKSTDTLSLDKLSVSVFDKENNLLQTRFLDNNGTAPSIFLLPKRGWDGVTDHLVFNPFSEFEIITPIHRLSYEWTFSDKTKKEFLLNSEIHPKEYQQKNQLSFPVRGRVLVYDAHEYNSHHRRFDYNFEPINQLGLVTNFMRYAFDFVLLNEQSHQSRNNGKNDADYFGFNAPVYAVAEGKVIYVAEHHKDDKRFDISKLKGNPLELYGNCVALQHADSSVSIYGHLKQNSIQVKLGEMIKANNQLGQIGVSGSSFFPHLHFEIRTSIDQTAEGLPSYFKNILLVEGKLKRKPLTGLVETGNIIETR